MKFKSLVLAAAALVCAGSTVYAQGDRGLCGSPEYIKALTYLWQGPRLDDGRPAVSDEMIDRLKHVTIEDAWAELMKLGYVNQYEGDWQLVNEDVNAAMCGRVFTAQFMPERPDYLDAVVDRCIKDGLEIKQKRTVSVALNALRKGDVYVADTYNKEWLGTVVGSNLGRGVYNKTGNGLITNGHVRDVEGLRKIQGFNAWTKGYDPSYMRQTMLVNYNVPIRMGKVTVIPGDVVLAKWGAVLFVPAHLVEHIVLTAEFTAVADDFASYAQDNKLLTPGQVDSVWDDKINDMFRDWYKSYKKKHKELRLTDEEIEKCLKGRNF